ncbi:Pof6 interactor protein 1 [Ceratocystis fimbriata CBS 114723]|uniref:Pof6 interactor protein 1 n=1 Tax=Ceratocystis fimbriata CBS 114723 TaxID=1035309 RepID=A0A2C5XHX8_9PEZI|nr:Pof6 interactor protein 1 [Ceratocystis fimbriata CBS 114723]
MASSAPGDSVPAIPVVPPPAHMLSQPELDLSKLQSLPADHQDIFVLTFVSNFSRHVLSLNAEDCTAQQFYVKKETFKVLNLTSPQPTRIIRNNLGQCLAHVFEHGDRKLLFETINELAAIVGGPKPKTEAESRNRHAAVSLLGHVYGAAGDSAIGLHQMAVGVLIRLLKSSSSHAGLRAAVFVALTKMVSMIQGSMDESVARDIWKQSRSHAAADKGALVIIAACDCMRALVQGTPFFRNSADFDKLETAVFKAIDSPSAPVRHASADCITEALVLAHSENVGESAAARAKKPKPKSLRRTATVTMATAGSGAEDDEIPSRSSSPAPGANGRRQDSLVLVVPEMVKILSNQYVKPATSNKGRAGIGVCYSMLFKKLGEKLVQANFVFLVEHFAADILVNSHIANNRYRLLMARKIVEILLQDIAGQRILGESGQIFVANALIAHVLKNSLQPATEKVDSTKETLIVALGAIRALVKALGSAANGFAEACRDALLQVLQHPSYSVQVHASACMKVFVYNCPQQLLPCLTVCMNSLSRELSQLASGRNSQRRCVGFSHGLSAALSVSPARPLHGAVDVNSRVLTMATNLLKSSGQSELRVSATQIQVAWILIGGLMALGPNFVKIHLSQLLLMWKNALPKPLAKDNTASRSLLEASFLAHVRECALGSILAFLQYNQRLLTVDVSKRIAAMLQSTSAFLRTLPAKKTTDDVALRLMPALQLFDFDLMVQRRVLQCYTKLVIMSPAGGSEALIHSNLLTAAISLFADPEKYGANSLSSSIATAAGAFETIWDVGDNSGFGVTGLVRGFSVVPLPGQHEIADDEKVLEDSSPEHDMDRLLLSPVCGTLEHDASVLYISDQTDNMAPDPTATEVVNTAIQLFAFIFPQTPAKVQESILEQIKTFASAGSLQRDPGRKAAINVNVATALLCTMRVVARETKSPTGNVTNMAVERLLQDMVRDFVLDEDPYVRSLGYAAVARLCNACGNAFTNTEIKFLVDTIVMNREPSARAGCAMAFGAIQSKVGGMAAGFHLKTIHSILITLANDPHPTVHFWALEALALASNAAGLGFSQYVSSTLGMVAQMYTSDTHNAEMASVITMNLEVDMSTTTAITRCVDSMINVLGPDLQDSTKSRELTLTLVSQFQGEKNTLVQQASLDCMEHLSLYAPGHIIFADYVQLLQKYMNSDHVTLRDAAVDGLYNVMKRNPQQVVSTARAGFERELWVVLDSDPAHDGIRNIIRSWMRQTALESTAAWVQRFQSVLKMTRQRDHGRNSQASKSQGPAIDLRDEEVAGFAGAAKDAENDGDGDDGIASSEAEPLRWQVTTFAMECLSELFLLVAKDAVATGGNSASQRELQARIGDVVQMAFSASTSGVLELRIWGLKIIGAVLRMFGKTPDPDFDEAMLLEQYQAQISSALTPAFAADSSPELAAEAVNVCANFISTGIVTDVERMGRILKTLVTALENLSKGTENAGIGDLKALSSNAQVMVKMAVFAAWAELQVASADQQYLVDVLRPHIATLTPLWLESLREFARLRFEPDISMTLGPPSLSGSLDTIYAALNRETLLKFYQDSWLKLVDAIASLIEQDSDFVFDALDDKKTDNSNAGGSGSVSGPNRHRSADINYRDEPLAFFFVLFGIAFEALATKPSQSDSLASEAQTLSILKALKKILHPSVSGHAIYRDAIFSETMDLLDRLALTDGLDVQGVIVEIARDLCIAHPSARKRNDSKNPDAETDEADTDLSEDIEQLFELTRIIVLVLSGLLPNLNDNSAQPVRHQMNEEAMLLVRTALEALADAADVFPAIIQTDLHACIIHIFATMLATPMCQDLVVPQTLPIFKRFIAGVTGLRGGVVANTSTASSAVSEGAVLQLRGCLRRFLSVYLIAQRREQPNALMCVKNALLASTILFTGGSNQLPASDPLVARYLDEVVDCLTDRMTAKTAANCIRSLLLQPSPTAADHSIARYLVPRLIAFATNTAPEDPEAARPLVMLALTKYSSTLPRERLPVAFAVMITALLAWASAEEEDPDTAGSSSGNSSGSSRSTYAHASARLLELAAVSADAFKAVVAGLNASQRAFLEAIVRHGQKPGAADQGHETQRGEQPTIELKMNFGA